MSCCLKWTESWRPHGSENSSVWHKHSHTEKWTHHQGMWRWNGQTTWTKDAQPHFLSQPQIFPLWDGVTYCETDTHTGTHTNTHTLRSVNKLWICVAYSYFSCPLHISLNLGTLSNGINTSSCLMYAVYSHKRPSNQALNQGYYFGIVKWKKENSFSDIYQVLREIRITALMWRKSSCCHTDYSSPVYFCPWKITSTFPGKIAYITWTVGHCVG